MANGRKYYSSKDRYSSRGKSLPLLPTDSTSNKTVKRVYRKAVEAPKTLAQTNTKAVFTLAKQVKSLQNLTHGYLQSRVQACHLEALTLPHYNQPIAFAMNNFYNNQPVWQGLVDPTTGLASGIPVSTFNKSVYDSGIQDQYEWNAQQAADVVSPITYKPVFSRLNIKFTIGHAGITQAARARVTILKLKPAYEATNKVNVAIPDSLGAYQNLALVGSDPSRNFFSPRYHKILYDRWVTVENPCRTADEKTLQERFISIPWKYKDHEKITPDFDNHPTGQQFWTNVPISDQLWVLISVNKQADSTLKAISMTQLNSWRDFHGVAG